MKQKKKQISRVLSLTLSLAFVGAPQFALLRQANAQDPNGISMPTLQLRDLRIDNEARQISSLMEAHVKFFKRGSELKQKNIVSPRDATEFKNDGDKRKDDLLTIKRALDSLINKLKQGNHWDETFDAQFLASLKSGGNARSVLTQAGGARKLFQAAVGEINVLKEEIEDEVRGVNNKQTGALANRNDRPFTAHAKPPFGKVCVLLLTAFFLATYGGQIPSFGACLLEDRYNNKGCVPRLNVCN